MARKIITTKARDEKTHEGLRTFIFRQPRKGVRGVKKTAVMFEARDGDVAPYRAAMGAPAAGNTLEIIRFRGHRFYAGDAQPAEYNSRTAQGAVAQFLRDFPGWTVL